jgi:D-arabinose 1-dehydrogenase-like Zn-dependent alcohol dehydrogenase
MKGRIAFIPAAHKIDFHEYDVPAPPAGGLVAEVTQSNVCGSEVHIWRGEFGGAMARCPAMR